MFGDLFEEFDNIEKELEVETNDNWDTGYDENVWRANSMEDIWLAELDNK